jgi:hypothetical protein
VTHDDRIKAAWLQAKFSSWPPHIGTKVKMWWPELRGKVALVVATEQYIKLGFKSVRVGTNKVRIQCGALVALVRDVDVFPPEFSVKDILKIL